jgi:hypothetical protein
MHVIARVATAAFALLLSATPLLAQRGIGDLGGSQNGGNSGGENPFGGNLFREDEQPLQPLPGGASDRTVGMQALQNRDYRLAIMQRQTIVPLVSGSANLFPTSDHSNVLAEPEQAPHSGFRCRGPNVLG